MSGNCKIEIITKIEAFDQIRHSTIPDRLSDIPDIRLGRKFRMLGVECHNFCPFAHPSDIPDIRPRRLRVHLAYNLWKRFLSGTFASTEWEPQAIPQSAVNAPPNCKRDYECDTHTPGPLRWLSLRLAAHPWAALRMHAAVPQLSFKIITGPACHWHSQPRRIRKGHWPPLEDCRGRDAS